MNDRITLQNGLDIHIRGDQINIKEYLDKFNIENSYSDEYVHISDALKEISNYEAPYQCLLDLYAQIKNESHEHVLKEEIAMLEGQISMLQSQTEDDGSDDIELFTNANIPVTDNAHVVSFLKRIYRNDNVDTHMLETINNLLSKYSSDVRVFLQNIISKNNSDKPLTCGEATLSAIMYAYNKELGYTEDNAREKILKLSAQYETELNNLKASADANIAIANAEIVRLNGEIVTLNNTVNYHKYYIDRIGLELGLPPKRDYYSSDEVFNKASDISAELVNAYTDIAILEGDIQAIAHSIGMDKNKNDHEKAQIINECAAKLAEITNLTNLVNDNQREIDDLAIKIRADKSNGVNYQLSDIEKVINTNDGLYQGSQNELADIRKKYSDIKVDYDNLSKEAAKILKTRINITTGSAVNNLIIINYLEQLANNLKLTKSKLETLQADHKRILDYVCGITGNKTTDPIINIINALNQIFDAKNKDYDALLTIINELRTRIGLGKGAKINAVRNKLTEILQNVDRLNTLRTDVIKKYNLDPAMDNDNLLVVIMQKINDLDAANASILKLGVDLNNAQGTIVAKDNEIKLKNDDIQKLQQDKVVLQKQIADAKKIKDEVIANRNADIAEIHNEYKTFLSNNVNPMIETINKKYEALLTEIDLNKMRYSTNQDYTNSNNTIREYMNDIKEKPHQNNIMSPLYSFAENILRSLYYEYNDKVHGFMYEPDMNIGYKISYIGNTLAFVQYMTDDDKNKLEQQITAYNTALNDYINYLTAVAINSLIKACCDLTETYLTIKANMINSQLQYIHSLNLDAMNETRLLKSYDEAYISMRLRPDLTLISNNFFKDRSPGRIDDILCELYVNEIIKLRHYNLTTSSHTTSTRINDELIHRHGEINNNNRYKHLLENDTNMMSTQEQVREIENSGVLNAAITPLDITVFTNKLIDIANKYVYGSDRKYDTVVCLYNLLTNNFVKDFCKNVNTINQIKTFDTSNLIAEIFNFKSRIDDGIISTIIWPQSDNINTPLYDTVVRIRTKCIEDILRYIIGTIHANESADPNQYNVIEQPGIMVLKRDNILDADYSAYKFVSISSTEYTIHDLATELCKSDIKISKITRIGTSDDPERLKIYTDEMNAYHDWEQKINTIANNNIYECIKLYNKCVVKSFFRKTSVAQISIKDVLKHTTRLDEKAFIIDNINTNLTSSVVKNVITHMNSVIQLYKYNIDIYTNKYHDLNPDIEDIGAKLIRIYLHIFNMCKLPINNTLLIYKFDHTKILCLKEFIFDNSIDIVINKAKYKNNENPFEYLHDHNLFMIRAYVKYVLNKDITDANYKYHDVLKEICSNAIIDDKRMSKLSPLIAYVPIINNKYWSHFVVSKCFEAKEYDITRYINTCAVPILLSNISNLDHNHTDDSTILLHIIYKHIYSKDDIISVIDANIANPNDKICNYLTLLLQKPGDHNTMLRELKNNIEHIYNYDVKNIINNAKPDVIPDINIVLTYLILKHLANINFEQYKSIIASINNIEDNDIKTLISSNPVFGYILSILTNDIDKFWDYINICKYIDDICDLINTSIMKPIDTYSPDVQTIIKDYQKNANQVFDLNVNTKLAKHLKAKLEAGEVAVIINTLNADPEIGNAYNTMIQNCTNYAGGNLNNCMREASIKHLKITINRELTRFVDKEAYINSAIKYWCSNENEFANIIMHNYNIKIPTYTMFNRILDKINLLNPSIHKHIAGCEIINAYLYVPYINIRHSDITTNLESYLSKVFNVNGNNIRDLTNECISKKPEEFINQLAKNTYSYTAAIEYRVYNDIITKANNNKSMFNITPELQMIRTVTDYRSSDSTLIYKWLDPILLKINYSNILRNQVADSPMFVCNMISNIDPLAICCYKPPNNSIAVQLVNLYNNICKCSLFKSRTTYDNTICCHITDSNINKFILDFGAYEDDVIKKSSYADMFYPSTRMYGASSQDNSTSRTILKIFISALCVILLISIITLALPIISKYQYHNQFMIRSS